MRTHGFSVWPASVAPLPTRARPKTLTFSMAKTLTFSMAIDILEPRSKLATARGWDPDPLQQLGRALTGGGRHGG